MGQGLASAGRVYRSNRGPGDPISLVHRAASEVGSRGAPLVQRGRPPAETPNEVLAAGVMREPSCIRAGLARLPSDYESPSTSHGGDVAQLAATVTAIRPATSTSPDLLHAAVDVILAPVWLADIPVPTLAWGRGNVPGS